MGAISSSPDIHMLAKNGQNAELMQAILRHPKLIDKRDKMGKTPLLIACEYNQVETVKILIDAGADRTLTSSPAGTGSKPIHVCAENGSKESLLHLLNIGEDINAQDTYGWTPLHFACDKRHGGTALLLIEQGADVNSVNHSKETPLHFAAKSGLSNLAQKLIDRKANVNAMDNDVWTPLHTACKWNRMETAVLLTKNGADVNALDEVRYEVHFNCIRPSRHSYLVAIFIKVSFVTYISLLRRRTMCLSNMRPRRN